MADGLNMVMHPLDTLKAGIGELLDKFGLVSRASANTKLPVLPQAASVSPGGKVTLPAGGLFS